MQLDQERRNIELNLENRIENRKNIEDGKLEQFNNAVEKGFRGMKRNNRIFSREDI